MARLAGRLPRYSWIDPSPPAGKLLSNSPLHLSTCVSHPRRKPARRTYLGKVGSGLKSWLAICAWCARSLPPLPLFPHLG